MELSILVSHSAPSRPAKQCNIVTIHCVFTRTHELSLKNTNTHIYNVHNR